jgi:exodeoxyribonuclease-5
MYELRLQLEAIAPNHPDRPELKAEYELEVDRVKRPWFHVNPDSIIRGADLLVVDEVSMVDEKIGKDIESFQKKVLVLGDPAQLPPVRGGGYFTDCKPDVLLTEIHRQALDNPLLQWATLARKGEVIPYGDLGLAKKFRRDLITDDWLSKAGQILVGKNETRHDLNKRIRKQLGFVGAYPQNHDRMVMLMNENRLGVLNGTIFRAIKSELAEYDTNVLYMDIMYEKEHLRGLKFDAGPFTGKECQPGRSVLQADYGYALTVHKAQGSQWPSVVVYDDGFAKRESSMRNRWLYTAITRAEKQLYIVTS